MKIISVFNNKGGVGKSTLCFHLACALNEMGKKVLLLDLDPQCNLTICGMKEEQLHAIWEEEEPFIDDYESAWKSDELVEKVLESPRSIHFLLKATEEGVNELENYPNPIKLYDNLDLIPGRLSIHQYENKIAERWSSVYQGDNLGIRTITNIRRICEKYNEINKYDYILVDTSPSLGVLNKVIISTVDGFFIPTQPDMFSLYGIRNIGTSLVLWQKEFNVIYTLLSEDKRNKFPPKFVQFIGYTLYNARVYTNGNNEYDLAKAHYAYAQGIPGVINEYIKSENRIGSDNLEKPIGGKAVMHSHNTFPSMAQALKCPMWLVPEKYAWCVQNDQEYLEEIKLEVNRGHNGSLRATKDKYVSFAKEFIERVDCLE